MQVSQVLVMTSHSLDCLSEPLQSRHLFIYLTNTSKLYKYLHFNMDICLISFIITSYDCVK